MKALTSTFIFLFFCSLAIAQAPLMRQWDRRFGGNNGDILKDFHQTSDEGYILGGYSWSDSSGDCSQPNRGIYDYWIVKVAWNYLKLWDKRFGGSSNDYLASVQQTTDGGYILGGYSNSPISGDKTDSSRGGMDYWLIKTDSSGNKQWDKTFGGAGADKAFAVQQTADGGYVLGGISDSDSSGDVSQPSRGSGDYWVLKTDSAGNKEWDKRFGGNSGDDCYSLQQTKDGGYILGGTSYSGISGDKSDSSRGSFDYWMVKIDTAGAKQWDKTFGGADPDYGYKVLQAADRGYVLAGLSHSEISGDKTEPSRGDQDFWVVKTDSSGNKLWDKRYGGTDREDEFGNIFQTADSGFLVAGTSYSPVGGDKSEPNLGLEQIWTVKTDVNGSRQWDKTVLTTGHDEQGLAIQIPGRCYLFANYTEAGFGGHKTWTSQGDDDYWLVKFCDTSQQCNTSAAITATQTEICASDSAQICGPAGFTNYQWNTGATTACITATQANNYFVSVTDGNGCSAVSNQIAITVNPLPVAPIGSDTAVCAGASAQICAPSGLTYQWNHGETTRCITATQAGNYHVTVTDANGCTAESNHLSLTVYSVPSDTITANQATFCSGDSAQVCAPSGFATYLWSTGASTVCIKAELAGNYYVTVTDNSGCTAESNHLAITVYPLPPLAISVNGDTLSVYGAVTQQWYLNGSAINGATAPVYIANQSGSYTVAVTDTNGCVATSSAVVISGVDNLSEEDVVSVYQLTVDGWQLTVGNNWLGSIVEVVDADGRVVFSSKLETLNSKLEINAARGVYLLRISSAKSSVVRKLVRL